MLDENAVSYYKSELVRNYVFFVYLSEPIL